MGGGRRAGYALTCLTVWAVVAAELACPTGFAIAWVVESVVIAFVARQIRTPIVPLRPWTPRDTAALCVVLLLVPGLMAAPYRNIGAADAEGARITAPTSRPTSCGTSRWPRSSAASRCRPVIPTWPIADVHYYWTYFLVPAAVAGSVPGLDDVESALKVNAECTAMLLLATMCLFARTAGQPPWPPRSASCSSCWLRAPRGLRPSWISSREDGRCRRSARSDIDAITAWWYNGLRIDGVHRTMFYNPQHSLSGTLGLLGLLAAAEAARARRAGQRLPPASCSASPRRSTHSSGPPSRRSTGLPCSVTRSYRAPVRAIVAHWPAAISPLLAVGWGILNKMGEGAGDAVTIGWAGFARNAPVLTLLLGLGPVLVPALAGFLPAKRLPGQPARVALVDFSSGCSCSTSWCSRNNRGWASARGQIMLAMLPLPLARLFDVLLGSRSARWRLCSRWRSYISFGYQLSELNRIGLSFRNKYEL